MMKKWLVYVLLFGMFFSLLGCDGNEKTLSRLKADDKILAFGDSLTYGTGASSETSYPSVLAKLSHLTVINGGIPGNETKDGVARIHAELASVHPRLVIVSLGGNDLIRRRPHAVIKENLTKIIHAIQQSGAEVILVGVPQPSIQLKVPDFYEQLGEELNIVVDVKTLPMLLNDPDYKSDHIHLNEAGYKRFAENIFQLMKKNGAL